MGVDFEDVRGRAGTVLSGETGDGLGVDPLDPLDVSAKAVANRDSKSRVAVVCLVPLWAPIKRVSVMSHPLLQPLNVVFEGCDDGLVEDLPVPDGGDQALGDPVEGDAVHIVPLEDVARRAGRDGGCGAHGCGGSVLGGEVEGLEVREWVHWGWVDDIGDPKAGVGRVV